MLAVILVLTFTGLSFAKVMKEHYPNGRIKAVVRYNNKKQLNGAYKYYWPNGKLKEQGRYRNGIHVGPIKRYSIDGVLLGQ